MNFSKQFNRQKLLKISLYIAIASALSACSDDADSTTPAPPQSPPVQTGIFVDSPVVNINYATDSKSGVTNSAGEFEFINGENLTFSFDSVVLPGVIAKEIITPLDLAKSISDDAVEQANIAVNIARFLQSFDDDNDPSNGIVFANDLELVSNIDFTLSHEDF